MTFELTPDTTLDDLIDHGIVLLREHEPPEGYHGCFSGGKDSCVIKELARMAGVKVDWHYSKTTIDPPELVRFIRREHPDVTFDRPKHGNFFRRAALVKGFPTRRQRWCCEEYKENSSPEGSTLILGIRAEESAKRAARYSDVMPGWKGSEELVLPILQWSSDEIWSFIRGRGIPYCELYDEGFHRLGCVGCPMASKSGRIREFERWPAFERKWRWVFETVWNRKHGTLQRDGRMWFGDRFFRNWEEMWRWWMSDKSLPKPLEKRTLDLFR